MVDASQPREWIARKIRDTAIEGLFEAFVIQFPEGSFFFGTADDGKELANHALQVSSKWITIIFFCRGQILACFSSMVMASHLQEGPNG